MGEEEKLGGHGETTVWGPGVSPVANFAGFADHIAALNLRERGRAAVGLPHADAVGSASSAVGERMPPALAAG